MSLVIAVKIACIFKPFLTIHASCEPLISGKLSRNEVVSANYRVTL